MTKSQENRLLTASIAFFKSNSIVWIPKKEGTHKETHLCMGLVDGNELPKEILPSFALFYGPVSQISNMRLSTATPKNHETIIAFCAFLLFGDFETIITEDKAPVILQNIVETQNIFLDEDYLKEALETPNSVFSTLTKGMKKAKDDATATAEAAREDYEKSRRDDDDGEAWKKGG